jgi:hypothetical protein
MKVETCKNCGAVIGQLEKAFVFQGQVVCEKCYKKLHPSLEKFPINAETQEAKTNRSNWLSRYKDKSGIRSFTFQVILATWTLLMLMVGIWIFFASLPPPGPSTEEEIGGWVLVGICFPLGVYLIIALPLLCFAIFTYGKSKE